MGAGPHYLVRLTYAPRILVYTLTSLTLGTLLERSGEVRWLLLIIGYSLLYPHLAYRIGGALLTSRQAVLRLQHLDAFHVGVYCAAVDFSPLPVTAFLTALLISNVLLAGGRSTAVSVIYLLLGALAAGVQGGFRFQLHLSLATSLLSGLSILLYAGLVGQLGFDNIRELKSGRAAMHHSNARLQNVTQSLRRYIAPQLYSALLAHGELEAARTTRKRLVVFFSDIEGFTELTDTMEAEALTELLNTYLQEMSEIALRFGGTIDKFMGDGIMIFFGDPYTKGAREDACACVRMALDMRERIRTLRREWAQGGITRPLHVRIGIHAGFCTVGNFGCDARLDYTVVGGTVNLASRLEALAGRDEILISEETRALIGPRFECAPRSGVVVKGVARAQNLFRVERERTGAKRPYQRRGRGLVLQVDPRVLDPIEAARLLRESADEIERAGRGEQQVPTRMVTETSADAARHTP